MQWGVEVTRFDLTLEQSQAAFAFVDLLQKGRGHPHRHSANAKSATGPSDNRGMTPMQLDIGAGYANSNHRDQLGNAKHGQDADADSEIPLAYAMTKADAKAVRKRGGSS